VTPDADAGGEPDLAYWKRRVAQNCIYGVDLNPLAVDLAKLSLWLATTAKGKPLSFLDHHLRCGNALVGARVASLTSDPSPKRGRGVAHQRRGEGSPLAGQLSMLDDADFADSSLALEVDALRRQQHLADQIAERQGRANIRLEPVEHFLNRRQSLDGALFIRLRLIDRLDRTVDIFF
jgi:hypothetical protein